MFCIPSITSCLNCRFRFYYYIHSRLLRYNKNYSNTRYSYTPSSEDNGASEERSTTVFGNKTRTGVLFGNKRNFLLYFSRIIAEKVTVQYMADTHQQICVYALPLEYGIYIGTVAIQLLCKPGDGTFLTM